jgi:hypothetical protein
MSSREPIALAKIVVLKLDGDLSQGYQATLEIGEEGKRPTLDLKSQLPPHLELLQDCENWRLSFRRLDGRKRLKAKLGQLTNVSLTDLYEDCRRAAHKLRHRFNAWMQADSFRPLKEKCLEWLNPEDEVRLLLRTNCRTLPRLPWHHWDLAERYD